MRENPFEFEALLRKNERDRDETYLEVEAEYVKAGEEEKEKEEEEAHGCFESDTSRRRIARLASRRARSMDRKVVKGKQRNEEGDE